MKQFILAAIMLLALTTTKATAQGSGPSKYISYNQTNTGWWDFTNDVYTNDVLHIKAGTVYTSYYSVVPEVITARRDTIMGTSPLIVISAAYQNDTVHLRGANYVTGQIINIITTYSGNDTLAITHDGNLNGATATYLLNPATSASYKKTSIYYDGTNYWFMQ